MRVQLNLLILPSTLFERLPDVGVDLFYRSNRLLIIGRTFRC